MPGLDGQKRDADPKLLTTIQQLASAGWSRGVSSQVIAPNTCHLPAGFYIAYLKLVAWTKLNERPHVHTNHTGHTLISNAKD